MDRRHDARRSGSDDTERAPGDATASPGKRTRVQAELAIGGASATGAHARGARARSRATLAGDPDAAPAQPPVRTAAGTLPPPPAASSPAPPAPALVPPAAAPPRASTPARAPATAGAPAPAAQPASADNVDGLVDPFMKARWDSTAFWALVARRGLPGAAAPEVMGELDRWLPLDLAPEARRAIHIAAALTSGLIDDTLWQLAEKMPALGPLLGAVHDVAGVAERVNRYQELGDPVGAAIAAAGGTLEVVHGLAEHVVAPLAMVSDAADKIEVAADVVEKLSIAGGPVVIGGIALKTTAKAVSDSIGWINDAATLVLVEIDGVGRFFDMIEIAYDATRVRGLEARAQFDRAGEYKDLMQGQAVEVVFGTVKNLIDVGGVVVTNLMSPLGWIIPADFAAGQLIGAAGSAVETAGDLTGALREAVGADASGLADFTIPILDVSLADVMHVDRPYLGPAHATGDATTDLARAGTVQAGATAQVAAIAARPEWHAGLNAAILATPGFAFATAPDPLRPTWYIEQVARMLRLGATTTGAAAVDGLGAVIDAVGAGLQPAIDLAVLGTNRFLATNLPPLQQLALDLDGELQKTRLDLAAAQSVVTTLQHLATAGRQAVPQVIAAGALVRDRMLATLAGMKIDLPDGPGLDELEAAVNSGVDAARDAVMTAYATGIVPLQIAVIRIVADIERQLAELQAALAHGGAVYQALDAQYQKVKTLIHDGTALFAQWQPVIPRIDVRSAGTWLRDLAVKSRTAIAIERGQVADPWRQDIVPTIAAPHVAAWKAAHTAELERAFYPTLVPAGELAACANLRTRGLAAIARLSPSQAAVATPMLADAFAACEAMGGQRGRRALLALWTHEDHLIRVVGEIEGWASTPQASPVPTPSPP